VAAIDLVSDLIELECLAAVEGDDDRRRRLLELRDRLAARAGGAKLSEAASVLGLSVPTVSSWVASGILELLPDRQPARVTYNSLAFTKRALDEIRRRRERPSAVDRRDAPNPGPVGARRSPPRPSARRRGRRATGARSA